MDRQQILDLYKWAPGICFRHPEDGLTETAQLSTVRPRDGDPEEVRACRVCVLGIEGAREEAARSARVSYEPGHAGEPLNLRPAEGGSSLEGPPGE